MRIGVVHKLRRPVWGGEVGVQKSHFWDDIVYGWPHITVILFIDDSMINVLYAYLSPMYIDNAIHYCIIYVSYSHPWIVQWKVCSTQVYRLYDCHPTNNSMGNTKVNRILKTQCRMQYVRNIFMAPFFVCNTVSF